MIIFLQQMFRKLNKRGEKMEERKAEEKMAIDNNETLISILVAIAIGTFGGIVNALISLLFH